MVNMSGIATLLVMAVLLAVSSFAVGMLPLFFALSSEYHSVEPAYGAFADLF